MYNSGIGTPYWFEWEIGILECLNMLQDTSIESVILQSTDFQALDDVVVNYSDKSILNIQVKHTDEDANFTYSFLASGKKPLLNELALEWKNNKDNYNFKGIQIVTNKKWGPQETDGKCSMDDFISKVFPCLQDNYNYTSAKPNEQKAIEWYRENLEINLDSNEAACFTKIFSFRKESCLADVEEKIRVKIGEILGTDNSDAIDFCLNSLLSKLNIWATSRREKQEITRENVYGALCYNLEIINLLKEDGYNEKAEGVILTQIDKREIGLHKLIMEAGDIIAQKHMEEYVNRCVVKFILSESKYGYIGSGISDVFERYYEMFNDNTWNLLFENIVTRFAESDYGIIASLWGDFTIFSIYYLSRIDKDKIKALFDCLCKTHESLSSANGRVKIKEEKLILDENITSLSDMVNFQLNI